MDHSVLRITKELSEIQKQPDLSIAVACRDSNVRNVKALIIGPHETPYEFGFFEFTIRFGKEYPSKSPAVECITTNGGRCRFNPNIYSSGKVCLSILGTWRGESREEWSSAQGLESVLLSIQSLMSDNPYENEPGFDTARTEQDKEAQKHYNAKIRHETLRISVIQRLESYLEIIPSVPSSAQRFPRRRVAAGPSPSSVDADADADSTPFEPFKDLCKRRFLWYYESYLAAIQKGKEEVKDDEPFVRMPFETPMSNGMDGKFNYTDLERRLQTIKGALDEESKTWAKEGLEAKRSDSTVAANLQHQFGQVTSWLKQMDMPHNIVLEDENPFVWAITYFGRPMTNLDGGLFRITMHFSPRFPHEQPRVRFESKIFHHLVAPDGTACYTPDPLRREDVRSHIDAIFNILEEDDFAYDPRKTVNPEAGKLFWGANEEGKKKYSRMLRRSVQRIMEDDFPQ
ncbi:ubiquitin-conjugating enzyme/RWD-like protein [Stachybotrys elegans]|uniref:Ubiquitin-conjugating enzyme E2 Z n=1 Tax=Stachybotrys elegans TaxID=80388 RepID=A0A8K0SWN4_9HYPO|nr:ubiquitin-conjugating enzyme/RWD-like protein [Stachybotrys elegans]